MKQVMEPHAVRGIPDAVTENPVAATDFSVTATVPPGRSPVPELAPLRRLAAKRVKIPSPDVSAMRARSAAISAGTGNGWRTWEEQTP